MHQLAIAISPDGTDAYLVHNACLAPAEDDREPASDARGLNPAEVNPDTGGVGAFRRFIVAKQATPASQAPTA